ncbi:uncharacterized protein PAC_11483 [Phialocephala subalpina]|uniref:Uncharacterized protein n=1 Tax=Phialocephala subalpina TaxID=576137 RepID=A0A1L7X9B7_9HELO|nr:uncharacterized protein PAC_11483 [Phialocephala subalpina]
MNAIDLNVKRVIVDPVNDPSISSGTYEWTEKASIPNAVKLQDTLVIKFSATEVIGLKAFVEASASATQKNGRPYNNRYAWIMVFSKETNKAVEMREYMNSVLVKELMETN